jgi:hypothetical protein
MIFFIGGTGGLTSGPHASLTGTLPFEHCSCPNPLEKKNGLFWSVLGYMLCSPGWPQTHDPSAWHKNGISEDLKLSIWLPKALSYRPQYRL